MRALSSSVASVRSSVRFSRATTKDGPHHSPPFLLFGKVILVTTGTRRRLLKAVDDDAASVLLSSSFAAEADGSVMSSMDEILLSPPDSDIITEDITEMHKRDLTNESIENVTPSPQTGESDFHRRTARVYVTNHGHMVMRSNFEFIRHGYGWIDIDD